MNTLYSKALQRRPTHTRLLKRGLAPSGFTIIELVVVIVILCVLGSLVALTYSGVQSKNRNAERQADIDTLKGQLESYYAQANAYPKLAELNDAQWRTQHIKKLGAGTIEDARWSDKTTGCTEKGRAVLISEPKANCYSYQVTAADGSPCTDAAAVCAHYTLTATLEGGEKYEKASLN